jgi:EmrB/QacA subfamily drug resistance transporter
VSDTSSPRRWLILTTCCLSLLIVGLDNTIMNVALPSLARDLGADISGLQWAIDAYVLVLAALLILAGSAADRFGRRRVFQTGLVVFTLASLLCSVAPTLPWLIGFRALQGVGASMLNPVAMSIITNVFTDRRERARAIGVWGGVVGISMALGPVLGGVLVDGVSWRAIFWINVPVGAAALVLSAVLVPESRAPRARRFDPVGQVLVAATLTGLTAGIIEGPRLGWSAPATVALFVVGVTGAVALVGYERRRIEPLLEMRFFRSAPFSGAILIGTSAFGALSGFLFLNTLYLQEVRGLSAVDAGLHTLPMAGLTMICGPLSGRLVGARGPRLPLVLAGAGMTIGALMLTREASGASMTWLLVAYAIFGAGFGAVNAPITNTAVSGMPLAQSGVAAAIASTSRQVGQLLGVAVIGTVLSSAVASNGLAAQIRSAAGPGWWIVVGCGVSVTVLGLITSGGWARETAARTAARLMNEPGSAPLPGAMRGATPAGLGEQTDAPPPGADPGATPPTPGATPGATPGPTPPTPGATPRTPGGQTDAGGRAPVVPVK